jgi:hypothetical protein
LQIKQSDDLSGATIEDAIPSSAGQRTPEVKVSESSVLSASRLQACQTFVTDSPR